MMNHSRRVIRREWRACPPAVRRTAAIIATAVVALLAAACGGSTARQNSSGFTAASAQENGGLAFSRCMRSHGVATFPDPTTGGVIPKETPQQLGVSSSQWQAAQSACQHLLPNGGSGPNSAQLQQAKAQALRFSQCVRNHGVPNFPDPDSGGRIPDPASVGIDQGSPQFQAANQACRRWRPPYMPSNAAYDAWASTSGS
jgi:hypothetical protein